MVATSARVGTVAIAVHPPAEMLLEIACFCRAEEGNGGEQSLLWLRTVREVAPFQLLDAIREFAAGDGYPFVSLLTIVERSGASSIAEFLVYLSDLDSATLFLHLCGYFHHTEEPRISAERILEAAFNGSAEARRRLLADMPGGRHGWPPSVQRLLALHPDEVKGVTLDLLRRWYEVVFRTREEDVVARLREDARRKTARARETDPLELIEGATRGIQYVPEPKLTRVLLIPSLVIYPWVQLTSWGETMAFCYPIDDDLHPGSPFGVPSQLLLLTRALGESSRLEILRLLSGRELCVEELAQHFQVNESAMAHHLMLLRAAGVVSVRTGTGRYSIRPGVLAELPFLLLSYLGLE